MQFVLNDHFLYFSVKMTWLRWTHQVVCWSVECGLLFQGAVVPPYKVHNFTFCCGHVIPCLCCSTLSFNGPTGKIYSSGAIWKEKKKRWYFQLWPICGLLFQSTVPQIVVLTELSQVFVTNNWDECGVMRSGELGLGKITDSAFSLQLFPVPVFLLHSCDLSVF